MQKDWRLVVRRADVGDRHAGLDAVPGHVWQRGDEKGEGGAQAGEARALWQ